MTRMIFMETHQHSSFLPKFFSFATVSLLKTTTKMSFYRVVQKNLFNSDWNYFMFFQFFFMGWKTDFTVLGFFFTVFSTSEENSEENHFFIVFFTRGENSEEKS